MMQRTFGQGLVCGALLVFLGAAPGIFAQVVGTSRKRVEDPEAAAQQKLLTDAKAALDAKNYAAAAQNYEGYLARQPNDAYAHFQLGYTYTAMQRPADAKPEYEKAV